MNEKIFNMIQEAIGEFEQQADPRFLVLGATGVGKSSLVNAIFDNPKLQAVNPIKSTTRDFSEPYEYEFGSGTKVLITDSPGYGEVSYDQEYRNNLVIKAEENHVVLLVLKADEKGYQRDIDVVEATANDRRYSINKPLLIALNQIDKIPPSREWNPPYEIDSSISSSDSKKLANMKEKISLVYEQFKKVIGQRDVIVVPTMAEPEEGVMFGIDKLKLAIAQILPDTVKYKYLRASNLAQCKIQSILNELDKEADKVIRIAAVAASAAVAVNPIPASDFLTLAPIQIGMVIKLGAVYGKHLDSGSAKEVLTTIGAGFVARSVFQGIISLIPFAKNVIGPVYAGAATHGMGTVAKEYFKNGSVPSNETISDVIQKHLS